MKAANVLLLAVAVPLTMAGCTPRQVDHGPIVYTRWPFSANEAKRRQRETAERLGVSAEKVVDLGGGVKFVLVLIPAGEFEMGGDESPEEVVRKIGGVQTEPGWSLWFRNEQPHHRVRITRSFWIGKHEVTQEVWAKVMGDNPSHFKGARNPVERVSWEDCQEFLKKLNTLVPRPAPLPGGEGEGMRAEFRLPTEAQWEYACRAGTKTPFHFGETISTDQANYDGNYTYGKGRKGAYRQKTVEVGSFPANAWGLHDMHGNVLEWCSDRYADEYYRESPREDPSGPADDPDVYQRVLRGGSWLRDPPMRCR